MKQFFSTRNGFLAHKKGCFLFFFFFGSQKKGTPLFCCLKKGKWLFLCLKWKISYFGYFWFHRIAFWFAQERLVLDVIVAPTGFWCLKRRACFPRDFLFLLNELDF